MVECAVAMRDDQKKVTAWAHHTPPFRERTERVGEMLQHMGGKEYVVGVIRHSIKPASLRNQSSARTDMRLRRV